MNIFIQFTSDITRRYPRHFTFLISIVLVKVFLSSLLVIAVAPIVDLLSKTDSENVSTITAYASLMISSIGGTLQLWHGLVFCGVVSVMVGVVSVLVQYATYRIKFDMLQRFISSTISLFLKARLLFFTEGNMGVFLNSFLQEVGKIGNAFGALTSLFANTFHSLIFLLIPLIFAPKITIIFIVITAVLSSPLWMLNRFTHRIGEKSTETANKATDALHETLTAAKLIIGFAKQEYAIGQYSNAFGKHAKIATILQTIISGVSLLFIPIAMIAALISSYVAYLDKVPFSEISMILFSLTRLSPIVGKLLQGKTIIVGFIPAYQQIEKLRSNALLLKEVHGNVQFTQFKSGIEFDRVTYSYPNRKPALNTVSLKIPKGQMIALVGKSGSGKTTIIDLLLGFYAQDEGRILLDGKELELYDLNSFRGQVGYVPQEPQLFNTSINENLLWSFPEASETDVWNACRIANAEEFVRELPEQLDTKLGDRGVRLSGGQKQRLALARAIIRKPKLLILDEATSALDSESEGLIKKSLDTLSGKMTILIIAHRLSTIRNADYMYVIEDGLIVESGKYRKLTENADSYFSKMVAEQAL